MVINCTCGKDLDLSKNINDIIECDNCHNIYLQIEEILLKIEINNSNFTFVIKSCFGSPTYIKIPSTIIYNNKTYYLDKIDEDAFYDCTDLKNVEIPNCVNDVDVCAFVGCLSLQYSTYDNINYLGNSNNLYLIVWRPTSRKIKSCVIHKNTKIIEDYTFYECRSLKNIEIPDSVIKIGRKTFESCTSLENIEIPKGIASIGDSAFEDCSNLKSVTISNNVTSIGVLCFALCNSLKEVVFEKDSKLKIIKNRAFSCCFSLESIVIPSDKPNGHNAHSGVCGGSYGVSTESMSIL